MSENSFSIIVCREILDSITNNYNYATDKLGNKKFNLITYLKNLLLYKKFVNTYSIKEIQIKFKEILYDHESDFSWLFNNLNDSYSKRVLTEILCYRILGHNSYKLPLDKKSYWEERKLVEKNKTGETFDNNKQTSIHKLYKHDLGYLNFNLKLFHFTEGIQATFCQEQYKYKTDETIICVSEDDVVIDAGACYGDTALYFASKTGDKGVVYSFEFIPNNITIFNKNIELNPQYKKNIKLHQYPLVDTNDIEYYFLDYGPGSVLLKDKPEIPHGTIKTTTIDRFIDNISEKKVDFIKMDIEGSELKALTAAEQVIRKFKPKLAISVYHNLEDMYKIPQWIASLNLGYKFYLGHYTTHQEETVLFAKT